MRRGTHVVLSLSLMTVVLAGLALIWGDGAWAQRGEEPSGDVLASRKARWEAIPLDVQFPDVEKLLAEAAKKQEEAVAASSVAWSTIISPEVLKEEIRRGVQETHDSIKNEGFFKSRGSRAAEDQYPLLAAMFNIAATYDKDLPWKKEAAALRDLAADAGMKTAEGDDAAFGQATKATAEIEKFLKTNKTSLSSTGPKVWADEIVYFTSIMKRMETAQRLRLRKWTTSQNEFIGNKADFMHEAQIMAAVSQIILDDSYALAAEGDYREWASQMRDNSLGALKAAKAENFDNANELIRSNNLSCSNCHNAYR